MTGTTNHPPLYGLVLAGGQSQRMGKDKASLPFRGSTLSQRGVDLLTPYCAHVFLSLNQPAHDETRPHIQDTISGIGPLGGLVSAMHTYPKVAWLVIACDMPHLTTDVIQHLIKHRNPHQMATGFQHSSLGFVEPLCTIYEPGILPLLEERITRQEFSLRDLLAHASAETLAMDSSARFNSINTPEAYQQLLHQTL